MTSSPHYDDKRSQLTLWALLVGPTHKLTVIVKIHAVWFWAGLVLHKV